MKRFATAAMIVALVAGGAFAQVENGRGFAYLPNRTSNQFMVQYVQAPVSLAGPVTVTLEFDYLDNNLWSGSFPGGGFTDGMLVRVSESSTVSYPDITQWGDNDWVSPPTGGPWNPSGSDTPMQLVASDQGFWTDRWASDEDNVAGWQHKSLTFTASSPAAYYGFQIRMNNDAGTPDTPEIAIDNVSMTINGSANLLTNGDFEAYNMLEANYNTYDPNFVGPGDAWANSTGVWNAWHAIAYPGFPTTDELDTDDDAGFESHISIWYDFLPGDANRDAVTDDADYTLWADNYNATPAIWPQGDFNKDGVVDDADYTIWADNYNAVATTPEPATLSLLGLGAVALIRRRR